MITARRRILAGGGLLLLACNLEAAGLCLSVSPFRASSVADSASGRIQKDRLLDSLREQLGNGWRVEPAGHCPSGAVVLDLFQRPGDLVESSASTLLRVRLEWRQTPGLTLVTLEPPGRLQGDVSLWSRTLAATVRTQMLVPLQVSADAEGAAVAGDLSGPLPASGLLPPGPLRLRASAANHQPLNLDTILALGRPLQLDLHLQRLPHAAMMPGKVRKRSRIGWVAYGAGVACLSGAGWFAWRQQQAADRYRSLAENASEAQFQARWNNVRQANLWRNGLAVGALGSFGIGIALQWNEASFPW